MQPAYMSYDFLSNSRASASTCESAAGDAPPQPVSAQSGSVGLRALGRYFVDKAQVIGNSEQDFTVFEN